VRELQKKLNLTTILVTHDQGEAMAIGDRIAVIDRGEVQQVGTPAEVYACPASVQVARFIGSPPMNLIHGQRVQDRGGVEFVSDDGLRWPAAGANGPIAAKRAGRFILGLRPEALRVAPASGAQLCGPTITAVVERIERLGAETWVSLRAGNLKLTIRTGPDSSPSMHTEVALGFAWEDAHWFDASSGRRV
jgi:ABC-type sugar transport system ATPase subunit